MTGRRNRAPNAAKFGKRCLPNWFFPPCAPADISAQRKFVICRDFAANISSIGFFIWIKKWNTENFKLKRIAVKFSANINWLLVYLFAGSSRLRGRRVTGSSRAPTPTWLCEIHVRGSSSTLRCQRCGVAPPHTGLREVFCTFRLFANQITHFFESSLPAFFQESRRPAFSKSFPSIRKPNNTIFLKVLWFSAFG